MLFVRIRRAPTKRGKTRRMSKARMSDSLTKGPLRKGKVVTESTAAPATRPTRVVPTTPMSIFQCSITRAKNLLKIHSLAHAKQARPPLFLADTHRAAVVLAVSALDALVRTHVIDCVLLRVSNPSETLPAVLRDRVKDYINQDSLLDAARAGDLRARVERAFREHFGDQSFQGVKKISETMRLLGCEDVFRTVAGSAGVNEERLRVDLGRFTKRRHTIAHCGDYDLNQSPPEENGITMKDAKNCIRLVEIVALEICKIH